MTFKKKSIIIIAATNRHYTLENVQFNTVFRLSSIYKEAGRPVRIGFGFKIQYTNFLSLETFDEPL